MNVLLAHNYYQIPGGEDGVFAAELEMLAANGIDVTTYVENNASLLSMSKSAVAINAIWSNIAYKRTLSVIREKNIDVAHFHNTFLCMSPSVFWACKKMKVPVVHTIHNYRMMCPSATLYRKTRVCEDCLRKTFAWPGILHCCYRNSRLQTSLSAATVGIHKLIGTWRDKIDIFIALTEFSKKKMIEGGIPASKIIVKPNFLFTDPGPKKTEGNFVLFVGLLADQKGVKTLLEAFKKIRSIPLKIAGSGPEQQNMQAFVQNNKMLNIEFLGRRPHKDILGIMKQAQLLVFPSKWHEGFPMTLVESMACGVPMVVSRLGAMEEVVDDGRTGFHFPPGNAEQLATAVEQLWNNPQLAMKMGKEARRDFEEKYSAEINFKILQEIYQRAKEVSNYK